MSQNSEPKNRGTFMHEFKQQIVDLSRSGKRKCDIIREYDISGSLLDKWIAQEQTLDPSRRKITVLQKMRNYFVFAKKTNSLRWKTTF